ncbi:hypothetical protein OIDMADRAFT_28704 [Oidiodendron maius Zn]|uniref:Uncharacterized protein n=1 Tax=Oidiodendron maius (strain Zn) TaxID=913774 RepID=A0A0C3GY15_OIDMZ|nr:hypothetical protein OIDMADRAFT_28704 [Oidiodendron maius Zn]
MRSRDLIGRPHCHVCEHEEQGGSVATRPNLPKNDTQPGSIKSQALLLQQMQGAAQQTGSSRGLGEDIARQVVYRSAQWQPSYAAGGGTDLTKMLRPTAHRTFSWGGLGSNVTIPSPDHSRSSSAPESGTEDHPKKPRLSHHPRSSRMGEMLRRRLEDRPLGVYDLDRRTASSQNSTPPLRTSPLRGNTSPSLPSTERRSPIGSSPITRSPVPTPQGESEGEKENGQGTKPELAQGLGKVRRFKGLKKSKENG